jgi:hypothetical protein
LADDEGWPWGFFIYRTVYTPESDQGLRTIALLRGLSTRDTNVLSLRIKNAGMVHQLSRFARILRTLLQLGVL